jgi:uncharacterized protein (DUF1015 family)
MARIYPFRALRYDTAKVKMEDVVTQPYDKITPAMQQAYYDRSKYNLIRVILGRKEPGDTDAFAPLPPGETAHNVYTRAAESLASWRKKAILREEPEPALYGYSQTYAVPGASSAGGDPEVRERRGFIALGQLYDYAEKVVYRHEQTFPKHKSDRLALFKATRAYCEQIYMLYSDPAFTAEKLIFESNPQPELEITDEYGVIHRVWKLTDPHLINLIVTAMADKKLIIADGHHRYETSVAYMHERAAELGIAGEPAVSPEEDDESPSNRAGDPHSLLPKPAFPEAAMMMTLINMEAPGITILPTHRVVTGLEFFSLPDFAMRASAFYTISELPRAASGPQLIAALDGTPDNAFVAATGDGNFLLTPQPEAIAPLLIGLPARQAQLGVAQLHTVVLDHLLGLTPDRIQATGHIQYLRDAAEAVALVAASKANIAFLIKPVTLDQLRHISLSGEVMPQKSTDFYPKLLSGLAIYALD